MRSIAILVVAALFLGGCTTENVMIQDVSIDTPVQQRPLHFINSDRVGAFFLSGGAHFFPRNTIQGRIDDHTNVSSDGSLYIDTVGDPGSREYRVYDYHNPYAFGGNNLSWHLPSASAHLAAAVNLTDNEYFRLGGQYASVNGVQNAGGFGALGLFRKFQDAAIALEFGYAYSRSRYQLSFAKLTDREIFGSNVDNYSTVELGEGEGDAVSANYFVSFTVNTCFPESDINGILRLSVDRQGLLNHSLHSNGSITTASHLAVLYTATPGLVFSITNNLHLTAAVQVSYDVFMRDGDRLLPMMPLVELQFFQ